MLGLGGWLAAGCAALIAICVWRAWVTRMEAVIRASHELRGPITAARLGLQLGVTSGELSTPRLRALDLELGRAALALDELNAVRRRPLRGPCRVVHPTPEPLDVAELVHTSVEVWRMIARTHQVQIRETWAPSIPRVLTDRGRVTQAVGNLLANALEHGGRHIEVRGLRTARGFRLEVQDDGPGLPAPLSVLTRRARHGRGTRGRGLAIVSEIAAAHGGSLTAAPSESGARLVLELPAVLDEAVSRPESAAGA
jgi:signal transduction histidine kinase